ncbi:MAG: hypothetical protein FWF83_08535 [Clostridiales bacterium]|nr:hypothetical protein [Clostridiales bacterium]
MSEEQAKEAQTKETQVKEDLRKVKGRLSQQAERLSLKEYLIEHPYISLGAAFLSGAVLGCSGEGREKAAKTMAEAVAAELFSHAKEENRRGQ